MWRNTVAIYSVLKKKNYKAKFSTSSIFKKYNKKTQKKRRRQFWKKKAIKNGKQIGKNMWGKLKQNSQLAQY
jgi:hypothetical protein